MTAAALAATTRPPARPAFEMTLGALSALGRAVSALVADLELELRVATEASGDRPACHRAPLHRRRRPGFRPPG